MQAKTIGVLTTSHHVVSWSLLLRASRFDFLYLQLYLSPILVISFSVADEGCHAFFDWGGWAIRFLGKLSLALPHCPGEGYNQFHDRCKLVLIVLLLLHEMFDQLLHPLHLIFVECAGFCLSIFIFVGAKLRLMLTTLHHVADSLSYLSFERESLTTTLAVSAFASAAIAILGLFALFRVGFGCSFSALVPRWLLLSLLCLLVFLAFPSRLCPRLVILGLFGLLLGLRERLLALARCFYSFNSFALHRFCKLGHGLFIDILGVLFAIEPADAQVEVIRVQMRVLWRFILWRVPWAGQTLNVDPIGLVIHWALDLHARWSLRTATALVARSRPLSIRPDWRRFRLHLRFRPWSWSRPWLWLWLIRHVLDRRALTLVLLLLCQLLYLFFQVVTHGLFRCYQRGFLSCNFFNLLNPCLLLVLLPVLALHLRRDALYATSMALKAISSRLFGERADILVGTAHIALSTLAAPGALSTFFTLSVWALLILWLLTLIVLQQVFHLFVELVDLDGQIFDRSFLQVDEVHDFLLCFLQIGDQLLLGLLVFFLDYLHADLLFEFLYIFDPIAQARENVLVLFLAYDARRSELLTAVLHIFCDFSEA